MEKIVLDTAIKFGAGRYRQEQGLLEQCGEEVKRFGKKAYIVAGPRAFAAVKERLIPGFEKAGLEYVVEIYEGACSYEGAKEYGDKALAAGCDEVVGIGGGKIMDFAKAVGESAGLGVVNIPTSMSTCAPFTTMSVMYTPEGAKKNCWRYEHEIDAVLVDMDVIAQCPIRYNAAGILDAMAKRIEIQNGKPVMRLEDNPYDLYMAFKMAENTYEVLEKYGQQAIEDNRQHKVTKILEEVHRKHHQELQPVCPGSHDLRWNPYLLHPGGKEGTSRRDRCSWPVCTAVLQSSDRGEGPVKGLHEVHGYAADLR